MKHRIHVHDIHFRSIPDHADKRKKPAVLRFNRRRLEREGLSLRRIHQHDDRVFEPSVGRDRKLLKNAPAGSRGNPTTIDRIGKRDQVEPFGRGLRSHHRHLPDDRPSLGHLNLIIGPDSRGPHQQHRTEHERQHSHESSEIQHEIVRVITVGIVPKGCTKEKGGSRWLPPSPDSPHPANSRALDLTSLRPG